MVPMATHNAIQEWGCAYKITHISAATYPRLLNMVSNQDLGSVLSSIVAYTKYLIYLICINIYENIKSVIQEWGCTYKINNISVATYHNRLKSVPIKA